MFDRQSPHFEIKLSKHGSALADDVLYIVSLIFLCCSYICN